jgi:hypothetical protein
MENITPKCFAESAWGGVLPVRRDKIWGMTNRLEGLLEKTLRCIPSALLTQHRSAPDTRPDRWHERGNTISPGL